MGSGWALWPLHGTDLFGRWSYGVTSLSWQQKKIASCHYSTGVWEPLVSKVVDVKLTGSLEQTVPLLLLLPPCHGYKASGLLSSFLLSPRTVMLACVAVRVLKESWYSEVSWEASPLTPATPRLVFHNTFRQGRRGGPVRGVQAVDRGPYNPPGMSTSALPSTNTVQV